MRVLQWMIERIEGSGKGTDTAFGTAPRYTDLNWSGLDFSVAQYEQVTSIDSAAWKTELGLHAELFQQLAYHLPAEMLSTQANLEARLNA